MPYLIDGHNLIHYLDDIQLEDPHDEAKLVLKLRGFCARRSKKVVVVFDHGLPGGYSQLSTSTVTVVFASAVSSNADKIIRERIASTQDVKGWIVVSSDNEILDEARIVGMRAIKCAEFAEILTHPTGTKPHKGINPNVMVSDDEVEEWLELFSVDTDEPVDDILPKQKARKTQATILREYPTARSDKTPEKSENTKNATERDNSRIKNADSEVATWLEAFTNAPPPEVTDKPKPVHIEKDHVPEEAGSEPVAEADDDLKGGALTVSENSVEAWLEVFGEKGNQREPTDPAFQRNDPKKQGRYRNNDGKREPTVHKRMATSDEVYLNDGEVDAWMDVFGVEDED